MEYVNPVSIAGMAQGPQGAMLPGTGAGPLDMYQKNQALGQAYDFLDMAKAAGAQNYVGDQWKMQTAHDMYPIEKQAKELGNRQTEAGIRSTDSATRLSDEKLATLRQGNRVQALAYVGSLAEPLAKIQNPMEAAALMKQARATYERMFPDDNEGLQFFDSYNGTPESLMQMQQAAGNAKHISTYADQALRQKQALLDQETTAKQGLQTQDIASKEKIAAANNATDLEVAKIRAMATERSSSGTNNWNLQRGKLLEELIEAETVLQTQGVEALTPRQKAVLIQGPRTLQGAVVGAEVRTEPERVGQAAEAKASGEIKGLIKGLKEPPAPVTPAKPQAPQELAKTQPDFSNDPVFKERLKEMGWDYEPDKYEYVKDHIGQYFRRPK